MLAFSLKISDDGRADIEVSLGTASHEQKEAAVTILTSALTKIGESMAMKKFGTGEAEVAPEDNPSTPLVEVLKDYDPEDDGSADYIPDSPDE